MVATRRQVQTGPDEEVVREQDPDLLLKKKAGRKPAVKTTTTYTKTETKPRSVRGRKTEPETTVEEPAKPATRGARTKKIAVEVDIEDEKLLPARPAKATRTGSVRAKKGTTATEDTASEVEPVDPRPTRATKSVSVRGRKAASIVQEPVEEIAVQSKSAGVGSIRGKKAAAAAAQEPVALPPPKTTRSTRGAAKATPLSPKKITQVNKPSARALKQTNDKPAAKTTRSKAQSTAKPTGRKRTVSDENADMPDLEVGIEDVEDEQEVIVLASTPVKASATSKRGTKQSQPVAVAASEASMSSRPTTPSDSLVHSFNTVEDQIDTQEDVDSASEVEQSGAEDGDASEDELCGPKTPMKRSSPTALARYQASVQRTIRKHEEDVRLETPAVRYAVLGTQQGTPQTQKPYCKPTAPASETRPMTVSRAAVRAFVFKDLRDGTPTLAGKADENFDEQDEPSFLPDDDIVPMDAVESEQNSSFFNTQPQPALDIDEAQLVANSLVEEDAEDYVVPANVQKYSDDPDDTVVIHDDDENMEAPSELPQSFETEDTVIITRAQSPMQEEDATNEEEEMTDDSVIIHSIQPSMKIGHRPVATIAVNFDEHLNDVRASPVKKPVHPDVDSVNDATMDHDQHADLNERTEFDQDVSIFHDVTRRQTLDLNMFIDMGALTEPTMHMQIETEEDQEAVAGAYASAEEEPHELHEPEPEETSKVIDLEHGSIFDDVLDNVQDATVSQAHDALFTETNKSDQTEAQETREAEDMEVVEEPEVPHYALPTIAFDARRKSLPVLSVRTPIRTGVRPNTSDGASMPRVANPFSNALWARSGVQSTSTTPAKPRPSDSAFNTPVRSRPSTTVASAVKTPKERYPLFPPKAAYSGHRNTVAAPVRFATPSKNSPKRRETFHKAATGTTVTHIVDSVPSTPAAATIATPKERYPALRSRENYEEHARTVAAPVRFQTPAKKSPHRRQTFHKALPGVNIESIATEEPEMATPVPKTPVPAPTITVQTPEEPATEKAVTTQERYPRLRPRQDYEEHAKTVAGPKRFNTPVKRSLNRPATVGRSTALRFAAIAASTPPSSYSPIKTPLKGPAMTPSQAPMTPHPAAPLRGIVALVEVFTLEGASASAPFISLLHRLGAKTTRSWNDRITHVVFKDGSPTTLQRVRLNNKDLEDTGKGSYIHCVNSRWVTDCDTEGVRVDESGDVYVVDVAEIPRGGKRRRKSMEPSALLNLGGNIVRDRKSSGGRVSSFGRSPAKLAEPVETSTPNSDAIGKENGSDEQGSPATPAWIAAPGQLVQHTAPMKRVRKLDLPAKGDAKSRRLTFWNGAT